jgi:ubiquinone/menaquinone biosynthesis C-methylase UbiE
MSRLAPGVPADYYDSIYAVEESHWWHRGMRAISATLLEDRLRDPGLRLLDAGCGTGGFLRFALDAGSPARLCGVDISSAAIELCGRRVPDAELYVTPVWEIPFEDGAFDVIVMNDVLQHLPEGRIGATFSELRRLLAPDGALLVRTGGAARLRRERDDWRAYDRRTLVRALEQGGFRCARATYVNLVPSLWAAARGRRPHAPTEEHHGVARTVPSGASSRMAARLLAAERRYLEDPRRALPYGHTLLALATPAA